MVGGIYLIWEIPKNSCQRVACVCPSDFRARLEALVSLLTKEGIKGRLRMTREATPCSPLSKGGTVRLLLIVFLVKLMHLKNLTHILSSSRSLF